MISVLSDEYVQTLLHRHGYGLVGAIVCLESIGFPLPGESIVIAAALYAASTQTLSIVPLVAVVAAGAIIGDNIGYGIGRGFGAWLIPRYGSRIGLTTKRLQTATYLFRRHGAKVVLFGRFVAVLRTFAAMLAGATGMHWPRFLIANAAGGVAWASLYGFGAYLLGHEVERLKGPIAIGVGCAAAVLVTAAIVITRRKERALAQEAERAAGAA